MTTFFISDLHLDNSRPDITGQFLHFLGGEARNASALYILGDLFEVWIGDDDVDYNTQQVQSALRSLTEAGVPCYIMHGNRDFLIGKRFCAATGCRLLADPTVVTIDQRRVLLTHGDLLCTDDHAYQRARIILRNPLVQGAFKLLSLARRRRIGSKIRAKSQAHIGNVMNASMEQIMDVNNEAVTRAFAKHGVDIMIHGHTHRPAVHTLVVNDQPATRIVLGDWYTQGSVLRWDPSGYALLKLTRPPQE